MAEGESSDPMDHFHRYGAISSVADDGFLAKEDNDYDGLFKNVNEGERFLQFLLNYANNGDLGFGNNKVKPPSGPVTHDAGGVSIHSVGGGENTDTFGGGRVSYRVDGLQSEGFKGGEFVVKGGDKGGIKAELGQPSAKFTEVEVQQRIAGVFDSLGNEGLAHDAGGVSIHCVGGGENTDTFGGGRVSDRVDELQSEGFKGDEFVVKGGDKGGIKAELRQPSAKFTEVEVQQRFAGVLDSLGNEGLAHDAGGVSIHSVGGGENTDTFGGGRVSNRVDGLQSEGFKGDEFAVKGGDKGGIKAELGQPSTKFTEVEVQQRIAGVFDSVGNEGLVGQGGGSVTRVGGNGVGNSVNAVTSVNSASAGGGAAVAGGVPGGTVLFVGDLHWWTTDVELEAELCKYGPVKEVNFFAEKSSGRSKGCCLVDFFKPYAATACKEGMNGHVFNGRSCVVAYESPFEVKKMGEAQVNAKKWSTHSSDVRRKKNTHSRDVDCLPQKMVPNSGGRNIATGGNCQGGDGNNRGYGRGNRGRGNNPGMGNRGPVNLIGNMGSGMGGRGITGNGGNGFGQCIGVTSPLMHPQLMMNQGFDPAFGGPLGGMGGYGGFLVVPTSPFSGIILPSISGVGLPGVEPLSHPALFGSGMPLNGMGMMFTSGMDGSNMGMRSDPSMGGWWCGEELGGGRARESSYWEEAASDHQFGEVSHDRTGWTNAVREKDGGVVRDWSGTSKKA
ncbi:hypothetical protein RIF29_21188 [Crotalaria pallida]|uniref:RRM domain-containing protein n=1 Tax=Crotalaria pallida TaxID=3830 RepID=A0AAN9F4A8_CROPI